MKSGDTWEVRRTRPQWDVWAMEQCWEAPGISGPSQSRTGISAGSSLFWPQASQGHVSICKSFTYAPQATEVHRHSPWDNQPQPTSWCTVTLYLIHVFVSIFWSSFPIREAVWLFFRFPWLVSALTKLRDPGFLAHVPTGKNDLTAEPGATRVLVPGCAWEVLGPLPSLPRPSLGSSDSSLVPGYYVFTGIPASVYFMSFVSFVGEDHQVFHALDYPVKWLV